MNFDPQKWWKSTLWGVERPGLQGFSWENKGKYKHLQIVTLAIVLEPRPHDPESGNILIIRPRYTPLP